MLNRQIEVSPEHPLYRLSANISDPASPGMIQIDLSIRITDANPEPVTEQQIVNALRSFLNSVENVTVNVADRYDTVVTSV